MKSNVAIITIGLFVACFSSCKKDDPEPDTTINGKFLVATMMPAPDGMSGAAYMQLIEDIEPKLLDNTHAIPFPFKSAPIVIGNDVFTVPGLAGETNMLVKYSRENGKLLKKGEYLLPSHSGATNVVTKGDIAYVSCMLLGKILVINHQTMEKVAEIDISSYGVGDQNPDPSAMLIRDKHLFVGLTQLVGGHFPSPDRPYSDVLIIDTDNNEVLKLISDSTSGISTATRYNDPYSIFMDENKNIYIVGLGAWGVLPGHNSGILRIKAGETEFDPNYQFVFNTTAIIGEPNPMDHLHAVMYAGNEKLYATANVPAYYSDPINYITDRTVVPVEIDLAAQTIKKIGLPRSNIFGVSVGTFENYVVFGLATDDSNGFYTYDAISGATSSSAVVTTNGFPTAFISFK